MEREASSMPGRGNNIIAYYRNYIISDFYNFIISEYCNFRNIYFHKFYIAVFRKKEASAICYIVALPLPHQRGKFLFVCTKIQLAISFLCAQKHNLLFSSVPLAVAAYPTRSLLLSHLEGEEPPEPFPCAAVSDGEGEPHRCQGEEVSLFSLFELSKEEPGGRSIRAIACYFLPLAPRAFVQSGELGFPL